MQEIFPMVLSPWKPKASKPHRYNHSSDVIPYCHLSECTYVPLPAKPLNKNSHTDTREKYLRALSRFPTTFLIINWRACCLIIFGVVVLTASMETDRLCKEITTEAHVSSGSSLRAILKYVTFRHHVPLTIYFNISF